jgi:hypothetical protein
VTDYWGDLPLDDAEQVKDNEPIHYRIHDADGSGVLAFGTARPGPSGWLQIADHHGRVQAANPGRFLILRRYDQSAGDGFDYEVGPASG